MSLFAHTHQALPLLLNSSRTAGPNTHAAEAAAPMSHLTMIKRFAKFVGVLLMMALAVVAVGGIKLAFYWPHFAH